MPAEADCRRETFGSGDAAVLLALFLSSAAGDESVRTREALAAVVANQVRRLQRQHDAAATGCEPQPVAALFVECLGRLAREPAASLRTDDAIFASCLRIARRAVAGALHDPTGGAVRFHRLGAPPKGASGTNLGLLIGPFLFYGDTHSHA